MKKISLIVVFLLFLFVVVACDGALEDTVRVQFDAKGAVDIEPIEGVAGERFTLPLAPEKEGHEFIGWFFDEGLERPFEEAIIPDVNITLYAGFERLVYTLTVDVESPLMINDIALNESMALVLDDEGSLYCWGNNLLSRCPVQTSDGQDTIWPGEWSVAKIFAWDHVAFVLTEDYKVYAWGDNAYGKLGIGEADETEVFVEITPIFSLDEDDYIVEIVGGEGHTLALSEHGKVYSWGRADDGALGRAVDEEGDATIPTDITNNFMLEEDETIISVAAALNRGYALTSHSRLFGWGRNTNGELDGIPGRNSFRPTEISDSYFEGDQQFSRISGSNDGFLAISDDNEVCINIPESREIYCGDTGHLTFGDPDDDGDTVLTDFAFNGTSLIMTSIYRPKGGGSGKVTVTSFGDNHDGLVAETDVASVPTISIVNDPPVVSEKSAMSSDQACALDEEGKLYCWGRMVSTESPVYSSDITSIDVVRDTEEKAVYGIDEAIPFFLTTRQTYTFEVRYGENINALLSEQFGDVVDDMIMPAEDMRILIESRNTDDED